MNNLDDMIASAFSKALSGKKMQARIDKVVAQEVENHSRELDNVVAEKVKGSIKRLESEPKTK